MPGTGVGGYVFSADTMALSHLVWADSLACGWSVPPVAGSSCSRRGDIHLSRGRSKAQELGFQAGQLLPLLVDGAQLLTKLRLHIRIHSAGFPSRQIWRDSHLFLRRLRLCGLLLWLLLCGLLLLLLLCALSSTGGPAVSFLLGSWRVEKRGRGEDQLFLQRKEIRVTHTLHGDTVRGERGDNPGVLIFVKRKKERVDSRDGGNYETA